jgi:apolipoprotein N-acyltransferase
LSHSYVGFLTGLAVASLGLPSGLSWLTIAVLAVEFWRLDKCRDWRQAGREGFLFGLGFFSLHLAWLPASFWTLFGPAGAAPMPVLVVALALMWAGVTAAARAVAGQYLLFALPFAWVLGEYLRSLGPLAFTWGSLGYTLLPTPLIQIADLGGVGLASLVVAASAASFAAAARGYHPAATATVGFVILVIPAVYGLTVKDAFLAGTEVLLVQGAVDPVGKARERGDWELDLYENLTASALRGGYQPDLVVWPEGAAPASPSEDDATARRLRQLAVPLIIGAPTRSHGQYRNSAYAFHGDVAGRYDKVKLVPFGEFFPLREALSPLYETAFRALGFPSLSGTTPGSSLKPLAVGGLSAGTYICYESTFPAIAREMVARGATLLVNISNDAWFGQSAGAEQHFQMGRVRAIETRRWIARAGNDGITAVIDPRGRVIQRFPRGSAGAFRATVGTSTERTPYVRLGDWPAGLSLASLVLVGAFARRRKYVP